MLQEGRRTEALAAMAPAMGEIYEAEEARGRAPVFAAGAQRAILAQLRRMEETDFLALDAGGEGLGYRLAAAAREAASTTPIKGKVGYSSRSLGSPTELAVPQAAKTIFT